MVMFAKSTCALDNGSRGIRIKIKMQFMKHFTNIHLVALLAGGLLFLTPVRAQPTATPKPGEADAQTVVGPLHFQAHTMVDVGYHFGNLWFAADRQNWPLAGYYLDQTRSCLKWAVQIQPVRTTKSGATVDLNGILQAVDNTMLTEIEKAIENKDAAGFKTAYRRTIEGCFACHSACEKPFLRVQVPDAPSATIINFSAPAEAAEGSAQGDEASRGKVFFQQNCALCHATILGPGNTVMAGQGPSLVGILGRRAGTGLNFGYSKALVDSRLNWLKAAHPRPFPGRVQRRRCRAPACRFRSLSRQSAQRDRLFDEALCHTVGCHPNRCSRYRACQRQLRRLAPCRAGPQT